MNVCLPGSRWVARVALTVALLPLLAECGPARNQFAPVCPNQAILGDAANLNVYRPSATQGPARDLTDLVVSGRIVSIHGTCQPGANSRQLNVAVAVNVELTRGPAIQGSGVTVPLFVAVTEGDTVLDKHGYLMHATFPSNVDRITLTPGELDLTLPVGATKSGAAYTLLTGFQLNPDQLRQSHSGGQ
ncbi:MAG TPA: hypothetical protein VL614_12050 [Acetobacteraceae bacterium]|nr:hypothetical protein [Acetobacteraceae bacterium]